MCSKHGAALRPKVVPKDVHKEMLSKQAVQQGSYNKGSKSRETFEEGEEVLVQKLRTKIWESGLTEKKHPHHRSDDVRMRNGRVFRRNAIRLEKDTASSLKGGDVG